MVFDKDAQKKQKDILLLDSMQKRLSHPDLSLLVRDSFDKSAQKKHSTGHFQKHNGLEHEHNSDIRNFLTPSIGNQSFANRSRSCTDLRSVGTAEDVSQERIWSGRSADSQLSVERPGSIYLPRLDNSSQGTKFITQTKQHVSNKRNDNLSHEYLHSLLKTKYLSKSSENLSSTSKGSSQSLISASMDNLLGGSRERLDTTNFVKSKDSDTDKGAEFSDNLQADNPREKSFSDVEGKEKQTTDLENNDDENITEYRKSSSSSVTGGFQSIYHRYLRVDSGEFDESLDIPIYEGGNVVVGHTKFFFD